MKTQIKKGSLVFTLKNPGCTYRVQAIGPRRAVVVLHDSAGYYRFYCAPSILVLA